MTSTKSAEMTLIVQLLIISVAGFMVQGAPTSNDCDLVRNILETAKTRSELENKTVHLYCVAKSLDIATRNLNDTKFFMIPVHNNTKMILNKTFDQFSYQCKNFTLALSIKHQLQDHIFNETNMAGIFQYNKPLYSILVYLETMSSILDDIEFSKHGNRCVRLTPSQYMMMYRVRYDDDSLFNALIKDMVKWVDRDYYEGGNTPSTHNCNIFYPSLLQK